MVAASSKKAKANREAGRVVSSKGSCLKSHFGGGKGNLAILIGELSDEPPHGRIDGIKQVVKERFPNINVTREQTGHWKREQGKTEDWLASGQEIDGVAANNDEMAFEKVSDEEYQK